MHVPDGPSYNDAPATWTSSDQNGKNGQVSSYQFPASLPNIHLKTLLNIGQILFIPRWKGLFYLLEAVNFRLALAYSGYNDNSSHIKVEDLSDWWGGTYLKTIIISSR